MRYNDMTKQDWEEYYIESKKDADNKTFHQYYNKYKLLTQPHISYSLDKSKNFEDFYTRLNHYGYRGIDGKVPMMADGGDVDARKTYLYIGKKSDGYYVMVSGNQPNLGGQILESGFTTATEAMDFAKEMAI
jgi:hypothetical protein